jgi:hypothetical protein
MTGHGSKFGRKMEAAIAALLSQRSIADAARVVNIGENTLLRWLQLPEFRTAYRKARREAVGQAASRMQQAASAATTTVLKIMTDPTAPAAVRLRAAEFILDRAIKSIELEEIEARVSELEESYRGETT